MKYAYYEPGDESTRPKTLPRGCECEVSPGDWIRETGSQVYWCFWRRRWPILQSSDIWAAMAEEMARARVKPPFDQGVGEGWEECGKDDAEEHQCRPIHSSIFCWGWSNISHCTADKDLVYRFRRRVKPAPEHEARYPIEWSDQRGAHVLRLGDRDYTQTAAQNRRDPDGREFAGFAFEERDFLSSWSILPGGPDQPAQRATHAVYRFEVTG